MLSDRNNERLVVRSCIDGTELVETSWETFVDTGRDHAIDCRSVDSLEEGKGLGIGRCLLVECTQLLDNNMRMPNDLSLGVQLLGGGEVVGCSVNEIAGLHVLNSHRDIERRVSLDGAKVLWVCELGARHVIGTGDGADRDRITGTGRDLLSIGDRSIDGKAEVDEVVRGRKGRRLSSNRWALPVISKARTNNTRVESQGCLSVTIIRGVVTRRTCAR